MTCKIIHFYPLFAGEGLVPKLPFEGAKESDQNDAVNSSKFLRLNFAENNQFLIF